MEVLVNKKFYIFILLWSMLMGSIFVVTIPFSETEIERILYYDKTELSFEINEVIYSYLESLGINKYVHLAEEDSSIKELHTDTIEFKWIQFVNRFYIPTEGPLVDPVTFQNLNEYLKPLKAEILSYEEEYYSNTRVLHMEIGFKGELLSEKLFNAVMETKEHGLREVDLADYNTDNNTDNDLGEYDPADHKSLDYDSSEHRLSGYDPGYYETGEDEVQKLGPVITRITFSQEGVLPPYSITGNQGKIAIIIDDVGYKLEGVEAFMELDRPLNFAVLPGRPHSYDESMLAGDAGYTVILHLPMEPINADVDPGPGSIWTGMSRQEVEAVIRDGLSMVPFSSGVNNHMGSKVTADEDMMVKVLSVLEEKGLPFIDSRTTRDSVVVDVGRELGMDVLTNHFFLDNKNEVEYIKERIRILGTRALREGYAIGIMHDKLDRPSALKSIIPELESAGIELVFLGELIGSEEQEYKSD